MRLARLLPFYVVLLVASCCSAQVEEPMPNRLDVHSVPSTDTALGAVRLRSQRPPKEDQQAVDIEPPRRSSSIALASGTLRSTVERLQRGQTPGLGVDIVDDKIRVEVLHDLESSEIRSLITGLGGVVEGEVEGLLVQALVPFDHLVGLERHDAVRFVRPPLDANVPTLPPLGEAAAAQSEGLIVGQEVAKTNADEWHAAGYTGAGVKVGIVDYFGNTLWSNAVTAGELPTPAGTFCLVGGTPCDIWTVSAGAQHGEAVAEVIHEMAPGAQLYLATVYSVTDLQAAVDYFASEGVDIISRSLTAKYDGPGDGTGPIATVIDNAVANGMAWFNSAGNSASDGSFYGQYWRGQWADGDADDWLDFQPGVELMPVWCLWANGLRWSDFGAVNPTDYDVCVFDNPGDPTPIGCSVDDQTAGAPPLELDIPCRFEWDYVAIALWDAGNGTSGDLLGFMINGGGLEHWQNPYSASGPASDTASPGALSVGAVDPPLGTDIAPYSSQGPTNDGLYGGTDRIKPDIGAAACVASFTYAPACFSGTSAATPAAAGAAALIIEAGLATTPAQVKTFLLTSAATDRGAPGPDNVFGVGELVLPAPPGTDSDGDGVPDDADKCPETHDPANDDYDGDGVPGTQPPSGATWGGDACDDDDDNDTVPDGDDADPVNEFVCQDLDADTCDDCSTLGQPDVSEDGTDTDSDGACDAGDPDDDNDGFDDAVENYIGTDPLDDCPDVVAPESGAQCDNTLDDDGDTRVDDGCPPVGPAESGAQCEDAVDDDGDTVVNDGCPAFAGDDAWPPDIYIDRSVDVVDVASYKGMLGYCQSEPEFNPRYDLDMSPSLACSPEELRVDILDVALYKPALGTSCSNP